MGFVRLQIAKFSCRFIFSQPKSKLEMADAIAARREARRRRILENSHNRLQYISGKVEIDCSRETFDKPMLSDLREEQVTAEICISKTSVCNGDLASEPSIEFPSFVQTTHHLDEAGDGEVANDLGALLSSPTVPVQSKSFWQNLTTYKYDIVLLSLLIQLLYSFSLVTFHDVYFFLPLIIYSLTKLWLMPKTSNSSFANILLLLNGVSKDRAQTLLLATQWLSILTQDVFVYLFVIICVQATCVSFKELLIT